MNDSCNLCNACTKICPTGALRSNGNGAGNLLFSSAFCIGCRLCEDFCRKDSILVVRGLAPGDQDISTSGKFVFCSQPTPHKPEDAAEVMAEISNMNPV